MKNATRVFWLGLAITLSTPSFAAGSLTAEKRADTLSLLQATGALEIGGTMSRALVRKMSDAIRDTRPNAPERVFDIVADEVNKAVSEEMRSTGGLIDLTVELYHKYFTHGEIKELLRFYQSPVGKKAGELAPVMSREGFLIGQRWGKYLAPKLNQRVKDRLKREGHTI
jgi:hypothetical protein